MKNIFTIAAFMLVATVGNAQTDGNKETKEVKIVKKTTESTAAIEQKENEIKNFRFGLAILPALKWYESEKSKIIDKDGVVPKFGGGLVIEFRLAKVAAIQTGINVITAGGRLKYKNGGELTPGASTVSYYYDENEEDVRELDDVNAAKMSSLTQYQLNRRNYKTTYINVPVLLKLKTREIGAMVYYGQFGLNSNFRWKGRATDDVIVLNGSASKGASDKKNNLTVSKDVSFYNAALNFGLGTEWNLAGTTSLVLGLSYNLGFTNVLKKESHYLQRRQNETGFDSITADSLYSVEPLEQILKENSLVLTIGVLF